MILYYINPAAKSQDIRVSAVSDQPLEYGKGYRVKANIGGALLSLAPDHWSEEKPGTQSDDSTEDKE